MFKPACTTDRRWTFISRMAAGLGLACLPLFAQQQRVDNHNLYKRIICVVPLVGSGAAGSPMRPRYAPLVSELDPKSRTGIIAYSFQESDDGRFAIVEFVATDVSAFKPILADLSVTAFTRGARPRAEVEAEFRKYKKDFRLDRFGVTMP